VRYIFYLTNNVVSNLFVFNKNLRYELFMKSKNRSLITTEIYTHMFTKNLQNIISLADYIISDKGKINE